MRTTDYLIEKHLDSTISEVEMRMLNERMLINPSLQKELALRHEINQMAIEDDIYHLRAKLNKASAFVEGNHENRFVSHRTKRVFYAAATIAGITVGSWAVFSGGGQEQNFDDIYRKSFIPYPPVTVFRQGNITTPDDDFFSTMRFYQDSHFAEAAAGLEKLLEINPGSATIQFYLGISYMELQKFNDSHRLFDELISGDSFFVEQAIWYKGLIYIAQGNIDMACNTLDKLAAYENPYTLESASLIKKLKQD
jgi:tetratricopeptide (TPR) repeat protein